MNSSKVSSLAPRCSPTRARSEGTSTPPCRRRCWPRTSSRPTYCACRSGSAWKRSWRPSSTSTDFASRSSFSYAACPGNHRAAAAGHAMPPTVADAKETDLMSARTGAEFLKGLRDDRAIWVGRERVRDVVDHPAFAGAARSMAALFDLQHEAADVCLMPDPETGEPINVSHLIPRSRADLERRHACLERQAEYSVGLMGRSPDYLNVTFAGFAGRADEWAVAGNPTGCREPRRVPEGDGTPRPVAHAHDHTRHDRQGARRRAAGGRRRRASQGQ